MTGLRSFQRRFVRSGAAEAEGPTRRRTWPSGLNEVPAAGSIRDDFEAKAWPAAAGEIDVDALQRHADELQAEIDDRRRHRL